jgi:hypothetical protein
VIYFRPASTNRSHWMGSGPSSVVYLIGGLPFGGRAGGRFCTQKVVGQRSLHGPSCFISSSLGTQGRCHTNWEHTHARSTSRDAERRHESA